jgi:hypothetical protein
VLMERQVATLEQSSRLNGVLAMWHVDYFSWASRGLCRSFCSAARGSLIPARLQLATRA